MGARCTGKLLLVEDEGTLRGLVAQFLRGEGYEVVEAADGLQAIERFSGQGPFDLVLQDLNLPFLPGIEVCRRIKAIEPTQRIIICSAAILDDHLSALERLRVDQFLTKPYHPADLLDRVSQEMSRDRRPGRHLARPAPSAGPWRSHDAHRMTAPSHALSKKRVID